MGKPKPWASVMAAFMSWNESVTASRKTRPMMPEIQIALSTPRGARRAASTVSSPKVPAVSKP